MGISPVPRKRKERQENALRQSTVVMVDMVGFSDIARSLQEHLSATAVHDLSQQIQGFFGKALRTIEDHKGYTVVSKPGDAILILFEQVDHAHRFARHVHCFAKEHNDGRSEKNAMRWFRIGIATGEVLSTYGADVSPEHAGTAIVNAVRLEAAAKPGEILIDVASFNRLSSEYRLEYGPEETVRGKRREEFRARRCCVTPSETTSSITLPTRLTRRSLLAGGSIAACGFAVAIAGRNTAIGRYTQSVVEQWMHPLPVKRFVVVIAWPHVAEAELEPSVAAAVDSVSSELTRAEASNPNLFIIQQRIGKTITTMAQIDALRASVGANLMLCVAASNARTGMEFLLQVIDPSTAAVLRHKILHLAKEDLLNLPRRAVDCATDLLGIDAATVGDARDAAGTHNAEAYAAFQKAEALRKKPNDAGLSDAIGAYGLALQLDSNYALANARLALAYFRRYHIDRNDGDLILTESCSRAAVRQNEHLVEGHLALASVLDWTGDKKNKDEAVSEISKALAIDPKNYSALLLQGQTLTRHNDWNGAESAFLRLQEARPNFWLGYEELGDAYARNGNYAGAMKQFEAAKTADPSRTLPLTNLSIMSLQMGNPEDAVNLARKSLALAEDQNGYTALSAALRCLNRYEEALASALKATELGPEFGDSWLELGDVYNGMKSHSHEAQKAFLKTAAAQEKRVDTERTDGSAWMLLALAQAKTGQLKESKLSVETADQNSSKDIDSQLRKVRILSLQGRAEEALDLVASCLSRGAKAFQFEHMPDVDILRDNKRFSGMLTSGPKQPKNS